MILLLSGAAYAAGPTPQPTGQDHAPAQAGEATRIETDQKTGIVRIIVNNREVARFDAKGLHVQQNVDYGGILTDTGNYDKQTKAAAKP